MREGKGVGSKAWVGGNLKRWEEKGWEEGVKGGNSRERKGRGKGWIQIPEGGLEGERVGEGNKI